MLLKVLESIPLNFVRRSRVSSRWHPLCPTRVKCRGSDLFHSLKNSEEILQAFEKYEKSKWWSSVYFDLRHKVLRSRRYPNLHFRSLAHNLSSGLLIIWPERCKSEVLLCLGWIRRWSEIICFLLRLNEKRHTIFDETELLSTTLECSGSSNAVIKAAKGKICRHSWTTCRENQMLNALGHNTWIIYDTAVSELEDRYIQNSECTLCWKICFENEQSRIWHTK